MLRVDVDFIDIEAKRDHVEKVEEAATKMQRFCILLPFEHDDLLEVLGIENFELIRLDTFINQVDAFINDLTFAIFILDNVLTEGRKHIHSVLYLVQLGAVNDLLVIILNSEVIFIKDVRIFFTKFKDGTIVRPHVRVVIRVRRRPFIIVKLECEDLTV